MNLLSAHNNPKCLLSEEGNINTQEARSDPPENAKERKGSWVWCSSQPENEVVIVFTNKITKNKGKGEKKPRQKEEMKQ